MSRTAILGISAYYHDSAAALIIDGAIVAAAQEERFSRCKHDPGFPHQAIRYLLDEIGLTLDDITAVAFYEKPLLKFERLIETYHAVAPHGLKSFLAAMPQWVTGKLFTRKMLQKELSAFDGNMPKLLFPEHHLSHAASAFFPSPFKDAAILTIDGVGEWACTTIGKGEGNAITVLQEQTFPHSLGLFYSAFTYYCGFKVNSGEYKLMGLAPYGNRGDRLNVLKAQILSELVDLRDDGSFALNMHYFNFAAGLTMTNDLAWEGLFRVSRRQPEATIDQKHMDLALACQEVTEEIVFRLARTARKLTGCDNLTLAGGVALNCVANSKILQERIFKNIWIQPAAGDAGGALGAALAAWHIWLDKPRVPQAPDAMKGALLGPEYTDRDIKRLLDRHQISYLAYDNFTELCGQVAQLVSEGNVVGWFQGRMEYGPRALGNRSILADPRCPDMQKRLNMKIKFREGFRPFAPAVLFEEAADYFDIDRPSPYMLLTAPVQESRRTPFDCAPPESDLLQRLNRSRSDIPAVTHVDYSARLQSVSDETNPRFSQMLEAFRELTGCAVLVNTSFNVRGEPIVCTPHDALRCFMATEMDYLVMGNFVVAKKELAMVNV